MAPRAPPRILSATYTSPSTAQPKHFSHTLQSPLPSSSSPSSPDPLSTQAKTVYLSELRGATQKLQEEINVFLTARMEEEKAEAARKGEAGGATNGAGATQAEAEREEERYGQDDGEEEEEGG